MHDTQTAIRTSLTATINSDVHQESTDVGNASSKDMQKPSPLTALLTRSVLITMANHAMLAFLEMSTLTLIPLMWSTPVEFGGLNFSPASIGLWMSVSGCMDGIFQFTVSPRVIGHFGMRRVLVSSIATAGVIFAMFPLENLVIRHITGGPGAMIGQLILLHLLSVSILEMGSGKILLCKSGTSRAELTRCHVYVYQFCGPEQAIIRRAKWSRAGCGLSSVRRWAGCCRFTICIFRDK